MPLLLSPPWINKYYVLDLSPGRSFVEWAVARGHTVFAISYVNPGSEHRDSGLDDYLRDGLLSALDVVCAITGAEQVNVGGAVPGRDARRRSRGLPGGGGRSAGAIADAAQHPARLP